jgi:hypothetical protein
MAFKTHYAEVSPARGEVGFCHLAKSELRAHISIIEVTLIRYGLDFISKPANMKAETGNIVGVAKKAKTSLAEEA